MDHENEPLDWSLLSGDDDLEHQANILENNGPDGAGETGPIHSNAGLPRPAEWLNNGASRWYLNDQSLRQFKEDRLSASQDEKAGWVTEEALLANHAIRKEDLTDLVRRGSIETVEEGPTRLYRITGIK